jgi:hypothetical protein
LVVQTKAVLIYISVGYLTLTDIQCCCRRRRNHVAAVVVAKIIVRVVFVAVMLMVVVTVIVAVVIVNLVISYADVGTVSSRRCRRSRKTVLLSSILLTGLMILV